MNNIFYIIGVVVVVLFIAGYFGLRDRPTADTSRESSSRAQPRLAQGRMESV